MTRSTPKRSWAIGLLVGALLNGCVAGSVPSKSAASPSGGPNAVASIQTSSTRDSTSSATGGTATTSPSLPSAAAAASIGSDVLRSRAQNGSGVFAIAYDPVHEMIWYVTDDAAGNPVLRGVATANGAVHDTRLPADEGYIGEFSPLKVDPAGAVWLASNVRLLRFDPTSGKLAAIVLASKVSGQLPGATTGSLQGIWPSGIGFLDGLTLVARANVPWLTEYDASLHEVGRIPLPATYAGAKDLIATGSGTLLLLPWQDECFNGGAPLLLMDQTGGVLGHVDIGGDRLYGLGSQILVSGSPGGASLVAGTAVTSVLPSTGAQYCSPNNYFASPDPRGGVTMFLRGMGPGGLSVLEHVVDQHVVSAVTFPPVDISNAPRPVGASPLTTTSFWLDALATDPTGTTWMGVGDSLDSTYLP